MLLQGKRSGGRVTEEEIVGLLKSARQLFVAGLAVVNCGVMLLEKGFGILQEAAFSFDDLHVELGGPLPFKSWVVSRKIFFHSILSWQTQEGKSIFFLYKFFVRSSSH